MTMDSQQLCYTNIIINLPQLFTDSTLNLVITLQSYVLFLFFYQYLIDESFLSNRNTAR